MGVLKFRTGEERERGRGGGLCEWYGEAPREGYTTRKRRREESKIDSR